MTQLSFRRAAPALASRRIPGSLLTVLLLLAFVFALHAQRTTADVLGVVTDSTGAVIPGAKVAVRNLDTNAESVATTDDGGNYIVTLLPIGRYAITSTKEGFKSWTVPEVRLAIGDRLRQDIQLQVGTIGESIEVTAASPALQTDSATVGSLINERAVQDLPLNGRNFVVLAQLAAGANEGEANSLASGARPDDRRQTSAISVNSQPSSSNNFLIDGMDDNERFIGTVIVKPSMDALVEMKVQTSLYSAELGRTAGGVVNFVTRSGTNEVHGSLFEFFRNEKMDARNFFAHTPGTAKPAYKQNQFGGSMGAPIRKNRLFVFGDYEGFRMVQGQTFVSTIPTLAMEQGNFAGVNPIFDPLSTVGNTRTEFPGDQIPAGRINPVGQALANLYPAPQIAGLVNNYTLSPNKTQNNDTFDVRGDGRLSNSDSLFLRYSFNNTHTVTPGSLPIAPSGINPVGDTGFSGPASQRAQAAQANYVHVFSPSLVMELKSGFSRLAVFSLPFNYGTNADTKLGIPGANVDNWSSGFGQVTLAGGYRALGDTGFIPLVTINNLFQEVANFSYIKGAHTIKVGADLRRRQMTPFQSSSPEGTFAFDANLTNDPSHTAGTGNSVATMLLGYPASTTRNKYMVWPGLRLWETAAYVQDDWRVTHWLTLNLGLRYDYYGPITEVANRISNIDLVAGRIIVAGQNGVNNGAGVQPDKKDFAPRFGFAATLSKRTVLRGGYAISFVPPFVGSPLALRNPPFVSLLTTTATNLAPSNKISDGFPPATATDPNNPTGNLAPVAFAGSTPYVQQYNLTLQHQLPKNFVATVGYVGALGRRQYIFNGTVNVNQPTPGPGSVNPRRPYYPIFPLVSNISVAGPWYNTDYHGLQATLERRFKSGLTLLSTYTYSHATDDFVQQENYPKQEYGNSYLDMRHRFTLLTSYDLPFGRTGKGAAAAVAHGWRVNAVVILATGLPFNITDATAQSNTGGTDRPNIIAGCNPTQGFTQNTYEWFNTGCFQYQPIYTWGNLARNYLHGPPHKELDLSIHREFRATERITVQFRAEAFNVTNTPAFGAPGSAYAPGSATFGVISSAGLPRNIQLALKTLF